jgi:hypothetical protein
MFIEACRSEKDADVLVLPDPQKTSDKDAVACPIIGTSSGHLYVLSPGGLLPLMKLRVKGWVLPRGCNRTGRPSGSGRCCRRPPPYFSIATSSRSAICAISTDGILEVDHRILVATRDKCIHTIKG